MGGLGGEFPGDGRAEDGPAGVAEKVAAGHGKSGHGGTRSKMEYLAAGYDFLGLLIEGDPLAGAGGGVGHDGCDGLLVASLHGSVGLFAGTDAFQPVPHVGGGEFVRAGVGRGGDGGWGFQIGGGE